MPKFDSHNHLIDRRLQSKPAKDPFVDLSFNRYSANDLKHDLQQYNARKAIVFPLPSESYSSRRLNRVVLEATKQNKNLFPVAFLHPRAAPREVFRYVRQGFVGFKIYSDISQPIATALSRIGKPVIIHPPFFPSSRLFPEMIQRLGTKVPIVLAHMGRAYNSQELAALLKAIAHKPNVFVDTSAFTAKSDTIEKIIRVLGPKRVLFGSDFPFGNLEGFQMIVDKQHLRKEHQHLSGKRILVSEKEYAWNTPELIQLSKSLKLPQLVMHKKASGQLFKVLLKLVRKKVLTVSDIENIFYNNAANLFKS